MTGERQRQKTGHTSVRGNERSSVSLHQTMPLRNYVFAWIAPPVQPLIMQRLAVVCVPLMALVQATTWTMYLSRRRGTIHSLERWRALAGYPKHATKIARSTPLRLVCHSFTSTIYLPILARKDGILIPYFLIRMCVRTVPPGRIV